MATLLHLGIPNIFFSFENFVQCCALDESGTVLMFVGINLFKTVHKAKAKFLKGGHPVHLNRDSGRSRPKETNMYNVSELGPVKTNWC